MNTTECELDLTTRVAEHIEDISEDMILAEIDDIKPDFLSADWESEFDDIDEAYVEQSRNGAESQVLQEHAKDVLGDQATSRDIAQFMAEMARQLGLSLD